MIGCICAAGACSAVLHGAQGRAEAAWIVPLAFAWGIMAIGGARSAHLREVLLVAFLVRLPLVGTPALLSDDLYRYLWEGLVLQHGLNPFAAAPQAISGLDDALRDRVNHPEVTSIYPPLALAWFQGLALLGRTAVVAQAATALVDLLVVQLLWSIRRDRGLATWPAMLYALHPLAALESSSGAHLDILGLALVLAAVWMFDRRRPTAPGLLLLAAGVKYLPALFAIPWLRRHGRDPWSMLGVMLAVGLLGMLALPVLDAGEGLTFAARNYHRHWSFNPLAFWLVEPLLGDWTRLTLIGVGGAAVAWTSWRHRDPARVWLVVATAFLFLSPTVHPWYALWALVPSLVAGRVGWALASTALLGSYLVLGTWDEATARWVEPGWLGVVTWGPALVALGLERWWSGPVEDAVAKALQGDGGVAERKQEEEG